MISFNTTPSLYGYLKKPFSTLPTLSMLQHPQSKVQEIDSLGRQLDKIFINKTTSQLDDLGQIAFLTFEETLQALRGRARGEQSIATLLEERRKDRERE